MSEVGESILRGLQEAVDFAEGKSDPKKYRVHIPDEINVQRICNKLNMNQQEFADHFGFGKRPVQELEQGRRVPSGATRSFLFVIDKEPEAVHRALTAEPA